MAMALVYPCTCGMIFVFRSKSHIYIFGKMTFFFSVILIAFVIVIVAIGVTVGVILTRDDKGK